MEMEKRPGQGAPTNAISAPDSTSVITKALEYAAQGLYVFPVRYDTNGEHKVNMRPVAEWRKNSTTSPQQIRRWFGPGGSWEGAKLAIDCGRSRLVVVDLDASNGKRGLEEWAALDAPATWRARTPTGGEHWYYREHPDHVIGVDASGKVAPNVDVRGLGGFVIAPPSVDGRGAYRWTEGEPGWSALPTVPPVVVERMTRRKPEQAASTPATPVADAPEAILRVTQLRDELAAAPDGSGNDTAARLAFMAGQYVGAGQVSADEATRIMLSALDGWTFQHQADRREMETTIRRQIAEGAAYPRPWEVARSVAESAEPTVDAVDALLSRMLDRDALDKIPAPRPLIRDVLDLESESWVIGPPGGFKSFVALDWACHVATGQVWRGKPVTQGRVVYVAAEGQKGIPLRVKAWEAMYGHRVADVLFLPEPVQVADVAAWSVLVQACRRLEPVLIVLDTQARITVGLDENSNGAMSVLTEAVRKLKAATGACVLVVHHTGRNGQDARGASAIDGAQDTEIRVERPESKAKRAALTATISTDKQKDGDESVRFDVQLRVMDLGTDPETGRSLSSLALAPYDPLAVIEREQPDWTANLTENQVEVMAAMREHSDESGATRAQAIEWVKARRAEHERPAMPKPSFDSAVKALVSKGLIARQGAGRIVLTEYVDAGE